MSIGNKMFVTGLKSVLMFDRGMKCPSARYGGIFNSIDIFPTMLNVRT
jgi:hypothetical protein